MTKTLGPRPDYEAIRAYRAPRSTAPIDLSSNTNQWGAAPSAMAALATCGERDLREYPGTDADDVVTAIAAYLGAAPANVLVGCGSDDLLDASMRALGAPGDTVAHPDPTFAMAAAFARTNSLQPIAVPLAANGAIDATAMLATNARIQYLCTPNNPTGTATARADIERVIAEASGAVIIDEAYAEFADDAFAADSPTYPNVLALRTFSKAFGLAGLRVGYAVGAPEMIETVRKARGPYRVSGPGERAATAALTRDVAWVRSIANEVRTVRARFADELRKLGFNSLPSHANFVCVPTPNARALAERIAGQGIAVRAFPGLRDVGDALRITLAPWPIMERVLGALREGVT